LLRQRGQALKAVEAADILVEAVWVGVTSAVVSVVAISAVSAVVTLVVPASAASTEAAFARHQLSQVAVRVLPAQVWVHQGAPSDTTMEAGTWLPRELTRQVVGRIDP
jgi:hypothetical protein